MKSFTPFLAAALVGLANVCLAQPAGITPEMINTFLPEEGAVKAVPGTHSVRTEPAFGAPLLLTFHPAVLDAFPKREKLPVVVWGHGGCALGNPRFDGFLQTIASHGFLVITTTATAAETPAPGTRPRQATADDLKSAIDWAVREDARQGSPLSGKIDTGQVAVVGQSCGGILAIGLGAVDPRIDTLVIFNSGVDPPNTAAPPSDRPTTEALKKLRGSVLFVDGHDRDFAKLRSRNSYDLTDLPAFYASRRGGGHLATFYHPGGGEMANVAANWLRWQLKRDGKAAKMFVGADCTLCTDSNWEVAAKKLKD